VVSLRLSALFFILILGALLPSLIRFGAENFVEQAAHSALAFITFEPNTQAALKGDVSEPAIGDVGTTITELVEAKEASYLHVGWKDETRPVMADYAVGDFVLNVSMIRGGWIEARKKKNTCPNIKKVQVKIHLR
jgi:hypothetical protein